MYVVKRDGHREPIMFDKITARVKKLCYELNPLVDPVRVAMRVIEGLYDGVTTSELDNLSFRNCCYNDYNASRLCETCSTYFSFELSTRIPKNRFPKR